MGSRSLISPARKFLKDLSKEITEDELAKMKFLLKDILGDGVCEDIKNPMLLFDRLLKLQLINVSDLTPLIEIMEEIDRLDLATNVTEFIDSNKSEKLSIIPPRMVVHQNTDLNFIEANSVSDNFESMVSARSLPNMMTSSSLEASNIIGSLPATCSPAISQASFDGILGNSHWNGSSSGSVDCSPSPTGITSSMLESTLQDNRTLPSGGDPSEMSQETNEKVPLNCMNSVEKQQDRGILHLSGATLQTFQETSRKLNFQDDDEDAEQQQQPCEALLPGPLEIENGNSNQGYSVEQFGEGFKDLEEDGPGNETNDLEPDLPLNDSNKKEITSSDKKVQPVNQIDWVSSDKSSFIDKFRSIQQQNSFRSSSASQSSNRRPSKKVSNCNLNGKMSFQASQGRLSAPKKEKSTD